MTGNEADILVMTFFKLTPLSQLTRVASGGDV